MKAGTAVFLRATGAKFTGNWTLNEPEDEVVIGRGSDATWKMDEALVSRRHAKLVWKNQKLEITDLGSRNGSRINGLPIRVPTVMAQGDRLELGPVTVTCTLASRDQALTVGCPAPAERTQATQVATRPRNRRAWTASAAALTAALACAGIALSPAENQRPSTLTPRPTPKPTPTPKPKPTAQHPMVASVAPPPAGQPEVAIGALRRRAIEAYAANHRREASRLFRRLQARLPNDRATAVVLASMEP